MRTDTWKSYSDKPKDQLSRKQERFIKSLTDAQKGLISARQQNAFKYGKAITALLAMPVIGMDSLAAVCRADPIWCAKNFPEILDGIQENCK